MVKKLPVERIGEIQNNLNEVYCLKCSIIDTLFEYLDTIRKMRVEAGIDKHYATNILDILSPTEPLVSKLLCSFLSFTQNGKFCLWRSFAENFLSRCGFDKQWVNQPIFSSEKYRIDILVLEQHYAVIIENKIHDAIFQRNQLARYIQITQSLTNSDNIFIVLLPKESYNGYIDDIPDSVWRLPCDWKVSNKERKYPYWGFKKVKEDELPDPAMVEKIKIKANVAILHDDKDDTFLSWGSTTNGFEDLKKYVQSAIDLSL